MRLSMQPLPLLTEAQVKLAGPVQPAGKALNPVVTDTFVACSPSSVVNVTLSVVADPMPALMDPGEGVATTLSLVGVDTAAFPFEVTLTLPAANIARLAPTIKRFR